MHPCFGSNTPLPDSSTKRGHLFQHRPTAPPPHLRPTGRSLPFSRTGACPPTTRPGLIIQNQLPNQLGHSLRARGKACPENTVGGVTVQPTLSRVSGVKRCCCESNSVFVSAHARRQAVGESVPLLKGFCRGPLQNQARESQLVSLYHYNSVVDVLEHELATLLPVDTWDVDVAFAPVELQFLVLSKPLANLD